MIALLKILILKKILSMKPFKKIRLAYLDDLENDPEVMGSLEKNPEELRGQWIEIVNPKSKEDWPEVIQDKSDPSNKFFDVADVGLIHKDASLHFYENGQFEYWGDDRRLFYNEQFDCMIYTDASWEFPDGMIDKALIVALLDLKREIDVMPRHLDSGDISVVYQYWLDGMYDA